MGIINFLLGLGFLALSVGFAPVSLRSDLSLIGAFVLFILSLVPFIVTFTKLGLNQEGEGAEESENRRKKISERLPHWEIPLYVGVAAFGLSMFFRSYIHPLYAFMAIGSLFSAYWFLHVYPVAKEALKEPIQPPEPTRGNGA
jgi:hypothetical protein